MSSFWKAVLGAELPLVVDAVDPAVLPHPERSLERRFVVRMVLL
jgi:hypothetical protein